MTDPNTARIISRDLLVGLLPPDGGEVDIDNPHQCCAFLWLCFECAGCGRQELFDSVDQDYPGGAWVRLAAQQARTDGWHVAPWSPDGHLDTRAWCPKCAPTKIQPRAMTSPP